MKPIALLTDFGTWDWYVASMKGVILGIAPEARIVDIAHKVRPGKIRSAAFMLEQCYRDFPEGTIFVCVVDPGVGSSRKAIAIQANGYTLVGPDNGLFSFLAKHGDCSALQIREITNTYLLKETPTHTFHGRDIFAPVAAHIATGKEFSSIGPELGEIARLAHPAPEFKKKKVTAEIAFIDHYGNGITNISRKTWTEHFGDAHNEILFNKKPIPLVNTFSAVKPGKPLAYFGSSDWLEIAVNQGNAAEHFDLYPGQTIKVRLPKE